MLSGGGELTAQFLETPVAVSLWNRVTPEQVRQAPVFFIQQKQLQFGPAEHLPKSWVRSASNRGMP